MQCVFVTMRATPAVGQNDRFVVVDETDTGTQKVVFQKLPLDSRRNREAEVHLLKVLLGDIQGFGSVDGVRLKTIIDGVDGILEVLTLFKA